MAGTSGRILRSEDIILDGQYRLNMGRTEIGQDESQPKNTVTTATRVSVLENHPEYAVLEVICACGLKSYLRCDYASSGPTDNEHLRDRSAEKTDQIN